MLWNLMKSAVVCLALLMYFGADAVARLDELCVENKSSQMCDPPVVCELDWQHAHGATHVQTCSLCNPDHWHGYYECDPFGYSHDDDPCGGDIVEEC